MLQKPGLIPQRCVCQAILNLPKCCAQHRSRHRCFSHAQPPLLCAFLPGSCGCASAPSPSLQFLRQRAACVGMSQRGALTAYALIAQSSAVLLLVCTSSLIDLHSSQPLRTLWPGRRRLRSSELHAAHAPPTSLCGTQAGWLILSPHHHHHHHHYTAHWFSQCALPEEGKRSSRTRLRVRSCTTSVLFSPSPTGLNPSRHERTHRLCYTVCRGCLGQGQPTRTTRC